MGNCMKVSLKLDWCKNCDEHNFQKAFSFSCGKKENVKHETIWQQIANLSIFKFGEVQKKLKNVNLIDLVKRLPTTIWSQESAPIQPITSLLKFLGTNSTFQTGVAVVVRSLLQSRSARVHWWKPMPRTWTRRPQSMGLPRRRTRTQQSGGPLAVRERRTDCGLERRQPTEANE